MNTEHSEKLFSYGTLQYEAVQLKTFGRTLLGKPDSLIGYQLKTIAIKDPEVIALSGEAEHHILNYTGSPDDEVFGRVFAISPQELAQADEYEVDDYQRITVTLHSGITAWVYVAKA